MQKPNDSQNFPAKYWHTIDDERIQCDLCPHHCKLREDQQGLCFVRARKNNQIVLTTYGKSSGFCVDPIEKKPLNHFLPGTSVFSFGTAGCNLACKFCQNWDISKSRENQTLADQAMPKTIAETAKKLNCKSVAFTYNEPIIFMEYAIDVAKECHKLGLKTVAVTNGFICDEPRKEFFSHIDAANVDLKAFTEQFYQKITGSSLQPVLDTLIYLKHHTNVWLEITNLIIPQENDSPEEINAMTKWIVKNLGPDVPIHFTAFFPAWKMLDHPSTPLETLTRAREIALKNGIRYAYTGNVHDIEGSSTYCHNCHNLLIERNGYNITKYKLTDDGHCCFCNTKCAGVFEGSPGTWGSKRQPIHL
jgi:pyruvate formate lyase activating enzyme